MWFLGETPESRFRILPSFPSVVVRRRPSQSERAYQKRFDLESLNFTLISVPTYAIVTTDMMSIAASCRLQNVIEYCIKVRKTGPVGKQLNISTTVVRITNIHMYADISKLSDTAFRLILPIGGLLVYANMAVVWRVRRSRLRLDAFNHSNHSSTVRRSLALASALHY